MTNHVRTGYRRHRRATWALAVALAAAVAIVVIPLATGQSSAGKYYRLTLTPSSVCPDNGTATTKLRLTNTASSQSLGSADVHFPPGTVKAVTSPATVRKNTTTTTSGGSKDIVTFRKLGLSPGNFREVTVSFNAGSFTALVDAVAKQSNNFSDAGGSANLFALDPAQGTFPTLRVGPCVSISGRVFHDRNADNTYTTGDGAFLNSDIPKAWTVRLYARDVGASSYGPPLTTTSDGNDGTYSFAGLAAGRDYKVCVVASGADASTPWGLQNPTGNTQCAPVFTGGDDSAGHLLGNLTSAATGKDFVAVPATAPIGPGGSSTAGGYEVVVASNSTKDTQRYTHETWVDSQGRTNFRFALIVPTPCSESPPAPNLFLLETLSADIDLGTFQTDPPSQAVLRYDDCPPFEDGDLEAMPYCSKDPRGASWASNQELETTGVLPGSHTSCIAEASQKVIPGGKLQIRYIVYSAFDGGRQIG